MISYNPKEWFGLFRLHKADTFRKLLPLIIFLCVYTGIICFIEVHWLQLSDKSYIRNINLMHNLLGFAISMLLVFRTNTAYDRWWEGRKLWGALVNNSRNLALKLHTFLPAEDKSDRDFFSKIIPLFAMELKNHLQKEVTRLALDEKPHPEIPEFDKDKHIPIQITAVIMQKIQQLYANKKITGDQLIVLNAELQSLMDICGACERIKNTPIPYSYSAFIKKFIFAYVITLPLGYVFSLGYLSILVVAFIFYVLASLELIAEEIEDPFGTDENDLPMQRIAGNIERNIKEIFE
jgi:ion channel-forming bestrophin family protein